MREDELAGIKFSVGELLLLQEIGREYQYEFRDIVQVKGMYDKCREAAKQSIFTSLDDRDYTKANMIVKKIRHIDEPFETFLRTKIQNGESANA